MQCRAVRMGVLGLVVCAVVASNAVASADADAFDPSTLCPSASPSAADLDFVYASLKATDQGSGTGFTSHLTTQLGSDALETSYTYDKADGRGSLRLALGSDFVIRGILDRPASKFYELVTHVSGGIDEDAQYNVGLTELGVHSAWVGTHETISAHDLLTAGRSWTDLAEVPASGPFGDGGTLSTTASYTCSVSGQTQSVSDGTNSWQMTVDAQGRVVGVKVDGNDPDAGAYTQTGSASYDGTNLVSRPSSISPTTLDKAIVRGFVKKLKPEIVSSSKTRFKKDHTNAKRVASLRAAAKSRVKAMLKKYDDDSEMTFKRTNIHQGVKVTFTYRDPEFGTHVSGYMNLKVNNKHVISSYHLPK